MFNNIDYGNFNVYNAIVQFRNVNNTDARSKTWAYASALDNCRDLFLYDFNIVGGTLIENVYDSHLVFNTGSGRTFQTMRVNNCTILGFPTSTTYTTNCRFDVGLEEALAKNSSYVTWNNVWPHGFRMSSGSYRYLAGLRSVDGFMSRCSMGSDDMVFGGSKYYDNSNNMQTDIDTFYNGTVTANLPIYNMNIKLNVDCNILNLGIFQAGPPHGFQNATISADTIYAIYNSSYYVQVNCDTRLYCENYCNVCFKPYVANFNSVLQPVVLINNYKHSNSIACNFFGGLTRIGRLNFQGGAPANLNLNAGAFVFINNALLGRTYVRQNSVLFLGSNVKQANAITVESGGLIVGKENWSSHASEIQSRIGREYRFAWNVWDSGPWGSQSLLNFCLNV